MPSPSALFTDGSCCDRVMITVGSAENLPKMGLLSGSSCDCFCEVEWCGQRFQTKTQRGTLSPPSLCSWDETHQFALSTSEGPGKYLHADAEAFHAAGGSLEIKTFDKGLRKALVGEARMPASEMARIVRTLGEGGNLETELRIQVSRKGQEVKGANSEPCLVRIKIGVQPDNTLTATSRARLRLQAASRQALGSRAFLRRRKAARVAVVFLMRFAAGQRLQQKRSAEVLVRLKVRRN